MVPRQHWLFKLGCWIAIVTAALHLVGTLSGPTPPSNDTERQLNDLATTYRFTLPGGSHRSLMEFMTGFSLAFALFLMTIGGLGLIVQKRGHADSVLMVAIARVLAGMGVVLLAISFTYFFIIPTMCIALATICFALASVPPPSSNRAT